MAMFDISDEIQLIDRAIDEWGTEPEQLFYALRACGMVAVIIEVFEGDRIEGGLVITAYGRFCVHEVAIYEGRVMLGSRSMDDKDNAPIDRFFVGPADNPASWEGVIRSIFRNERAILQMVDFRGRVRREWDEYLRIRGDRLGF
jgi:hypothetical protein